MAKLHYRSYNPNQIILFPQRIDEDIAGNDPVRIISAIIDHLDLSKWMKLLHKTSVTLMKRWNSPHSTFRNISGAERGSFFLASHNGQGRKEMEKGTSEDIQRIGKAFKEAK